ncbi:MAG: ABC transporter permease [Vicinamibacteria bacterium]
MSPRWAKTVRDVWQERARSLMVVCAIALGIAAFSSVLSTYAIINRELNQGYLATNPASFTLRTDALDDAVIALVRSNPGVQTAEPRRVVSGRMKAGPANWRNVMFFVVNDYAAIQVSKLVPETGAWPPAVGEVLIERDAFQVAKASVGDSVAIRMQNGIEKTLKVTGGVHDVGQAQARMENIVYAYITLDTLALLGEKPYLDQLKVVVSGDGLDRDHIGRVADDVKKQLEAAGHLVRRVEIPDPGKHPHADLMAMLLLAISTFGLLVLALSGVLVVNLLTAIMASQVRQIGVMKAIGGSRRQIAQIYFGQALLLGVLATLVALPLSLVGSRQLSLYLARFLNFDMTSFAVPLWVYILVGLIGLATPLMAAAYPVLKGTGLSVAAALADFGVSDRGFGQGRLDRALASVGGVARPLLLAVRNSFRQRVRLALTLTTLSIAGLFFMAALNVRASMMNTIDHLFASKLFDLTLGLGALGPYEPVERAIARTPGTVRAEGWIASDASIVSGSGSVTPAAESNPHGGTAASALSHSGGSSPASGESRFSVLGVTPKTRMLDLDIGEGRDLLPDDVDAIIFNTALAARNPGIKVGQSVILRMGPAEASWKVIGIAREAFSPPTAYVSRNYFDRVGGHAGAANTVRIAMERSDEASMATFKAALDRNLDTEGVKVTGSLTKLDSRYGFDQHMLMIYIFLVVMSVIIGSVGGLGLMTTMSLNVLERRREMGVLRAVGASSRMVWMIIVTEGVTVGLLSFVVAALLAWPLSRGLGNFIGSALFGSSLANVFEVRGLVIWLAVSIGLSLIASFIPAWNASRSSVREALGFE